MKRTKICTFSTWRDAPRRVPFGSKIEIMNPMHLSLNPENPEILLSPLCILSSATLSLCGRRSLVPFQLSLVTFGWTY
jgi:hypothetical protein